MFNPGGAFQINKDPKQPRYMSLINIARRMAIPKDNVVAGGSIRPSNFPHDGKVMAFIKRVREKNGTLPS